MAVRFVQDGLPGPGGQSGWERKAIGYMARPALPAPLTISARLRRQVRMPDLSGGLLDDRLIDGTSVVSRWLIIGLTIVWRNRYGADIFPQPLQSLP